jgi:hypothetical protein
MPVVSRSLNQALSPSAFETPESGQRWMKSKLHLILQIEISLRKTLQQFWQVGGKLIPQISLDQIVDG